MTHVFCKVLIFGSCLFWDGTPSIAATQPGDSVSFYIETYGEVLPTTDAAVGRAHRVFDRVKAVADKSSKRLPKLVIVNSKADPWAIALPDGHIVLSRKAVAICHHQADVAEAEARLAFVLGHELAHLAHDDFWHREVYTFVANKPDTQINIAGIVQEDPSRAIEKELAADDTGFIYAALAGFPVDRLVRTKENKPQFFEYWMRQTHRRANGKQPTTNKRTQLLLRRLHDLEDKIHLFHYGVRLSHFDYCDDAIYFLREFQKTFPGRAVLNNIGYCYLQMARQEMESQRAYLYWMPLLLDVETRAQFLLHRGGAPIKTLRQAASGAAQDLLVEAEGYLQRASSADPGYLPAKINLAVAYLYLGRPHSARSVLDVARDTAPDDVNVEILDALALYEQTQAGLDLWPAAVSKLQKVVAEPDAPESARFNLARLLALHSRPAEAEGHWNHLASLANKLPDAIRFVVCREQSKGQTESCQRPIPASQTAPGEWPVEQSSVSRLSKNVRDAQLGDWRVIGFDWFNDSLYGHIYQRPDGQAEVLELDGFVQMQVLKGGAFGPMASLRDHCSRPLRVRQVLQGALLSCGNWSALEKDGKVKELWSIK